METTPAASPSLKNRTTVRSRQGVPGVARAMMNVLSTLAPAAAEEKAARWFCTPEGRRTLSPPSILGVSPRAFTVRSGPHTLAAWSFGEGPTALLVHGWEGLARQLTGFGQALLERGHRVVAFDLPAHGASTGEETHALEMAEAVRAVAEVTGPVRALVAHSLGGTASVFALGAGLSVERAVLLAPALEPVLFAHRLAQGLGFTPEREAGMLARLEARLGRSLESLRLTEHVRGVLTKGLVLHDPADLEVPFQHGEALANAWPGAQLEAVPGRGHRHILRDAEVIQKAANFIGHPGVRAAEKA